MQGSSLIFVPPMDKDIILFDGVCNFCNRYINFIIENDIDNRFIYASFQSAAVVKIAAYYQLDVNNCNSIIVIHEEHVYTKSDAIIYIAKHLKGKWSKMIVQLSLVPKFARNYIYRHVANNRYNLLGQSQSCLVPNQDIINKFLI